MLRAISSENFPPFGNMRMLFPPVQNPEPGLAEVHLFTGINGTGKTRLLSSIAAILGQSESLKKRVKGMDRPTDRFFTTDAVAARNNPTQANWNGMRVQNENSTLINHNQDYQWFQNVPAFAYSGAAYVSDAAIKVMADIPKPDKNTCLAFTRPESQSALLLQAITNLKIQSAMDLQESHEQSEGVKQSYEPSHATRLIRALENTISNVTARRFFFKLPATPK